MLYLTQGQTSALFSAIRVILQFASMYFIKNVVSRAYNLTYMERVNAGFISKLRYIFWAPFPKGKKHAFGRFMVLVALVVSASLTWLPTLLNNLFPVEPTYRDDFKRELPFSSYDQLQLTRTKPNRTYVLDLLGDMGIELPSTERFSSFSNPSPPTMTSCTHGAPGTYVATGDDGVLMTCFGDTKVSLGRFSDNQAYVFQNPGTAPYNPGTIPTNPGATPTSPGTLPTNPSTLPTDPGTLPTDPGTLPTNPGTAPTNPGTAPTNPGTAPINPNFQYFNIQGLGSPNLGLVYNNLSPVSSGNFSENNENGIRSVESCIAVIGSARQCVRHTLGYLIVDKKGVLIIEKKLIHQGKGSNDQYQYVYYPQTSPCDDLAAPTWREMCAVMERTNPYPPAAGNVYGYQSLTKTDTGVRRDVIWLESTSQGTSAYGGAKRSYGGLSLEISISGYAGLPNTTEILRWYQNNTSAKDANCYWGQELFEATNILSTSTYTKADNWTSWGFSKTDIANMTNFILQGTPVYNGYINLEYTKQLVSIPEFLLYIFAGVVVTLVGLGYFAGYNVDSAVKAPFSVIIAATATSTAIPKGFWAKKPVANMTLRRPTPFLQDPGHKTRLPPTIHVDTLQLTVEGDEIRLLSDKV
ncbi:hypothetical protein BGX31_004833 [Mortierella sp. GBA43]|nr:hypothetical protein BGX31_004833 [Mortierella sp. GBA43]